MYMYTTTTSITSSSFQRPHSRQSDQFQLGSPQGWHVRYVHPQTFDAQLPPPQTSQVMPLALTMAEVLVQAPNPGQVLVPEIRLDWCCHLWSLNQKLIASWVWATTKWYIVIRISSFDTFTIRSHPRTHLQRKHILLQKHVCSSKDSSLDTILRASWPCWTRYLTNSLGYSIIICEALK